MELWEMLNITLHVTSFTWCILRDRVSISIISLNVEAVLRSSICFCNVPSEAHNCVTASKNIGQYTALWQREESKTLCCSMSHSRQFKILGSEIHLWNSSTGRYKMFISGNSKAIFYSYLIFSYHAPIRNEKVK